MKIIGLTGGIGMGKSTAAAMLRKFGLPVHDSDHAVHTMLAKGGAAVKKIAHLFPDALEDGAIDRAKLGQIVFADTKKLRQLEKILHPMVQKEEKDFLRAMKRESHRAVVLEIPLLFETGAEKRCDVVLCVSAPVKVQKQRVLKRKNMTVKKLTAILARQMPAPKKRKMADFVVGTGISHAATRKQLRTILREIDVLD